MRFYLSVPFAEKEQAKDLGCLWDPNKKLWYLSRENKEAMTRWALTTPKENLVLKGEDRAFGGSNLFVDLVPKTCWFTNVRTCIDKGDWNKLRQAIYKRANYQCECCQANSPLDAHERWEFDEDTKIQKLVRLIALCKPCHEVTHIGLAQIKGREGIVIKHLMNVTGMNKTDAEMHIDDAFNLWSKRNLYNWELDLSIILNSGINLKK